MDVLTTDSYSETLVHTFVADTRERLRALGAPLAVTQHAWVYTRMHHVSAHEIRPGEFSIRFSNRFPFPFESFVFYPLISVFAIEGEWVALIDGDPDVPEHLMNLHLQWRKEARKMARNVEILLVLALVLIGFVARKQGHAHGHA